MVLSAIAQRTVYGPASFIQRTVQGAHNADSRISHQSNPVSVPWSCQHAKVDSHFAGKTADVAVSSVWGRKLVNANPGFEVPQKTGLGRGVKVVAQAVSTGTSRKTRRAENVEGDFFVDHTCIDCDTCRWMAPEIYSRIGNKSAVHHQPQTPEERTRALQALLACPTSSIWTEKPPKDIKDAQATFPLAIDTETLPGVFHNGYHSESSYGATSYFVQRPELGNILVDSPRFTEVLAKRIEQMGGIRYMFLTHQDDVADHAKWAARFGCERIIHEDDVRQSTRDVERKLEGSGPWTIDDEIELIHTPGHTAGCVSMFYKPHKALFTGDHLANARSTGGLSIFRGVNWYSVPKQVESVRKLIPLDFLWLLPGHGRRYHFKDDVDRREKLEALVAQES